MTEIYDIIEPGIPGPIGVNTPELVEAARNRASQVAEQTAREVVLPELIDNLGNSETEAYAEFDSLVFERLTRGAPNQTLTYFGAYGVPSAERPEWAGIVEWVIRPGQAIPAGVILGKDEVVQLSQVAAENTPGFGLEFTGPAQLLGLSPSGRKPAIMATRAAVNGSSWGQDGSGNAGLQDSSGAGNATCVWEGLSANGRILFAFGNVGARANAGIVVRYVDNANYIYITRQGGTSARWAMFQVVNGTGSLIVLGPTGQNVTSNATGTITMAGQSIVMVVNGVTVFNQTVATHQTGTKHGLYASGGTDETMPAFFARSISFEAAA